MLIQVAFFIHISFWLIFTLISMKVVLTGRNLNPYVQVYDLYTKNANFTDQINSYVQVSDLYTKNMRLTNQVNSYVQVSDLYTKNANFTDHLKKHKFPTCTKTRYHTTTINTASFCVFACLFPRKR